jgi:hypothetical protein
MIKFLFRLEEPNNMNFSFSLHNKLSKFSNLNIEISGQTRPIFSKFSKYNLFIILFDNQSDIFLQDINIITLEEGAKAILQMQITSPTFSSTFYELYKKGVCGVIVRPKNILLIVDLYYNRSVTLFYQKYH